jgi:hypothetical protein
LNFEFLLFWIIMMCLGMVQQGASYEEKNGEEDEMGIF